jgi:hypothetical protein
MRNSFRVQQVARKTNAHCPGFAKLENGNHDYQGIPGECQMAEAIMANPLAWFEGTQLPQPAHDACLRDSFMATLANTFMAPR